MRVVNFGYVCSKFRYVAILFVEQFRCDLLPRSALHLVRELGALLRKFRAFV